jgi:NAD(P)H-hydrate epimerase
MKKITKKTIQKILPKRTKYSNKATAGNVLIVGSSKNYLGAGILSTLSATRSGAGYVHLMSDIKKFNIIDYPDFILHKPSLTQLKRMKEFAIGIGPGLGTEKSKVKLIKYLIKNKFLKVVLDADALTILKNENIIHLPASWIMTPHEGEASRLLNSSLEKVKLNREDAILKLQEKFKCHILLKGANTLLVDTQKNIFCVSEGTVALSKAGSGDVLTGIIAAMLAQKLSSIDALKAAAFIHGRASRLYLKKGNDYLSLRPTDLIELIPKAIKSLR